MFSITDYGDMIADKVRIDAYALALRQSVRSESVVIDIGTGTGIFALLACRFGARRVYAIEPDDAIQVAREIAVANGYADRIEFIQAMSTRVTLPERADVIISDIGDVLPWFGHHIPSIADARRRFLAPGGILIAQRDVAWAAVVDGRDLYARLTERWEHNSFGFDLQAARRIAVNTFNLGRVTRENLLTEPVRWGSIDYAVVEDPDVKAQIAWTVTRRGTAHGLAAGFDRTMLEGICMSNAPDAPKAIQPRVYRPVFLPWQAPVTVEVGDVVTVDLEGRLVRDDYIWSWKTRVSDQRHLGTEKANFTQSTFFGAPMSPATLQKRGANHTPALNEEGRIARFVLDSMNGGVSLGEIALQVSTQFCARFPRPEDALNYVADLSRQYG